MARNMPHPATLAAQGLGWTDPATGAVVLPFHTATTFERDPDNQYRRGRSYGRADNPGYDQPQALITALEGGAASLLFASGMASATAVLTRPLALGADIVMHSATKYLNGHSDVIAGSLTAAREDEFWQRLVAARSSGGAILGSLEAYLLLRGMRTLHVRVERACRSAMRIAEHFAGHDKVRGVLYPGLPDHSGHAVAARQMQGGFGGMLSIRVRGG